jgi:hypothetical protein
VTDANGVERSTETRGLIINSKAKEEAVLIFIYKFLRAREQVSWNDGSMHLFKFELHLQQGLYQIDWKEILGATNPHNDCNVEFFEEQVQNMLSNLRQRRMVRNGQLRTYLEQETKIDDLQAGNSVLVLSLDYDNTSVT